MVRPTKVEAPREPALEGKARELCSISLLIRYRRTRPPFHHNGVQ